MKAPGNQQNTPDQLRLIHETFCEFQEHSYQGIPGVICIDSGKDGPTTAISTLTHGNEYAPLVALAHLATPAELQKKIIRGKVFLMIHNLEAGNRFFKALQDADYNLKEIPDAMLYRKTEEGIDMNRLPHDILTNDSYKDPEAIRVRELQPIDAQITDGKFDVHTAHRERNTMAINDDNNIFSFADTSVRNILSHMEKKPIVAFTAGGIKNAVGAEIGQHDDPESIKQAARFLNTFLAHHGQFYIDSFDKKEPSREKQRVVHVIGSVC